MAACRLSARAEADLDGFYESTIVNFWLTEVRDYRNGLHEGFRRLAEQPLFGRGATRISVVSQFEIGRDHRLSSGVSLLTYETNVRKTTSIIDNQKITPMIQIVHTTGEQLAANHEPERLVYHDSNQAATLHPAHQ